VLCDRCFAVAFHPLYALKTRIRASRFGMPNERSEVRDLVKQCGLSGSLLAALAASPPAVRLPFGAAGSRSSSTSWDSGRR
jgi:hypothetical protein